MPLDLTSPGSLNTEPHYRRYLRRDGTILVVCVQDFDYDPSRFVDQDTFTTSVEAEAAPISTWQLVRAVEADEDPVTRAQAARNLEAVRRHETAPGHRAQCRPRDCRCGCPRTQDCQDCGRCVCWRPTCCAVQPRD
ncbi:hypothetical protein [Streptomyces sp. NPDC091416]|uniref:hypothetical protein n=1 Tax=Streptomyces sp. NPDC091416 TaxID=3366003 RepID=UPI00380ACFA1